MVFRALHGDFVGPSIGRSICLLNRLGGNVLHHSSWWSCPHVLRLFWALAQRRLNVVNNPLCLMPERSSFFKDGIPNLYVRFALPCFRSFQIWQHVAEQNGLASSWRPLTLSTFYRVRAVVTGPGGFFFIIVPLARKDMTHLKMVLRLGMLSWCWQRNSRWVSIIDSPLFTKLSYVNTWCSRPVGHDVNWNGMAWRVSLPPTQASTPSTRSITFI